MPLLIRSKKRSRPGTRKCQHLINKSLQSNLTGCHAGHGHTNVELALLAHSVTTRIASPEPSNCLAAFPSPVLRCCRARTIADPLPLRHHISDTNAAAQGIGVQHRQHRTTSRSGLECAHGNRESGKISPLKRFPAVPSDRATQYLLLCTFLRTSPARPFNAARAIDSNRVA